MTPDEQTIVSLIAAHDLTAAAAAQNWSTIADALNDETVEQHDTSRVSMRTTLTALGERATAVVAAFEAHPIGRQGLAKLADDGIDFGDPLTADLVAGLVAAEAITQQDADVLTALSVTWCSPAAAAGMTELVTAAAVETAWNNANLHAQATQIKQRIDALYGEARIGNAVAAATLASVEAQVAPL